MSISVVGISTVGWRLRTQMVVPCESFRSVFFPFATAPRIMGHVPGVSSLGKVFRHVSYLTGLEEAMLTAEWRIATAIPIRE